jgi:Protein of unknown function (DUF3105)
MGRRMARKDRAPTPPKRPQAPQRRSTPASPEDSAKRRRLILILGATALVALAVVLGVVFLAGGDDGDDVAATMEAAGCEFQAVPAQPGDHTAEQDATDDPKWNTDPPTSGPHYPVPAVYGEYDSPLQIAQVVHNLEHGAIFILHGDDVPEAMVAQLREFYDEDPNGVLLAPYPKLGDEIALGAWTVPDDFQEGDAGGTAYLATCPSFDEGAFGTFRGEMRYRGPERFPPESLEPGVS